MPNHQSIDIISSAPTLHIAFGVDQTYFLPASATIASIASHNRELDLVFHILAPQVPEDERLFFKALADSHSKKIIIHEIGEDFQNKFTAFPSRNWISLAAFIRVLIPDTLKGITDRVLYLDSDILCQGSLSGLLELDLGEAVAAAVSDINEQKNCVRLGMRHGRYFNSGFLFIDIGAWLASGLTIATVQAQLDLGERSWLGDQDALNVALDGRVKYIENKWNYQYSIETNLRYGNPRMRADRNREDGSTRPFSLKEVALIHFIGQVKPWHSWMPHEAAQIYQAYMRMLPEHPNSLPTGPKTATDIRIVSKYFRRQNKYIEGMKWFGKYLARKLSPG